jgi:hypothetical protein
MKALSRFELSTLACIFIAALLAGCGGSQSPLGTPGTMPQLTSQSREIVKPSQVTPTYKVSGPLLYVVSNDPSYVFIFDVKANGPKPIATISKGLDFPSRPCLDGDGTLYVPNAPDNYAGWILEYALGQTKPLVKITKGIGTPAGCAIDASGNLWVTNISGNVTEYLKGSTKPSTVITKGLTYPTAIAIDHSGSLYVANPEPFSAPNIQVYAAGKKSPSRTITDGVTFPVGIAVDAHSVLYVENLFYSCNIEEYRAGQGEPYRTITDELYGPLAVVVGRNGWLYVADEPGAQGCSSSSNPTAILEFPPHSLKPSSREITKGISDPEGLAYYPPLLP